MSLNPDATDPAHDASQSLEPRPDAPPRVSAPPPRMGRPLLIGLAVLFGSSMVGSAFVFPLSLHHPLLLIALSPLTRHIILVAPHTDMVPLVVVAALRGLCTCILSYEIGRHYGPRGVQLFERSSPRMGRFVRSFERLFSRAGLVFVLVFPGPLTSMLAAISGHPRWTTWAVSSVGLAAWASINYKVGDWLGPYTTPILAFVQRNLLPATLACVLLVLGYNWIMRKRRLERPTE